MAEYRCEVCDYIYDEKSGGASWNDLPENWICPVCGSSKAYFTACSGEGSVEETESSGTVKKDVLAQFGRKSDDLEETMADIHTMAETGESILDPMRTSRPVVGWEDLLIRGAQLARIPLNESDAVVTETVIGPAAKQPLVIQTPVYISHMSYGALSREAKLALSRGSAMVQTAMCSGEGGILPESRECAHKYIFEYVPATYSVSPENLEKADAVEIKIGQSAKPGMGGHLPGKKVTQEIATVRGVEPGRDVTSPSRFSDISTPEELASKVAWLREVSGGKPIGVKIAAGRIEDDLAVILRSRPDFITIDGRPGATGAAPKYIKGATSVPSVFALYRARKFLDEAGADKVSLVVTGGLRTSADFAKALALGADAIAIATAALIACGCQQYRACHLGTCPMGIATQDEELRSRLDIERSAERLANYLRVCTSELRTFARLTGNRNVHDLSNADLCTVSSEISRHTAIEHV